MDVPVGVIVAVFCLGKSRFFPEASRTQIPKLVTSIGLVDDTVAVAVTVPPVTSACRSTWENGEPARAIPTAMTWVSSSVATASRIRTLFRLISTPRRCVLHRAVFSTGQRSPSGNALHRALRHDLPSISTDRGQLADHGSYTVGYTPHGESGAIVRRGAGMGGEVLRG